ncbi:S8 family serine peptidase [Nonlabens ulvanivorans]|uniref:Secreted protein (Por secretion system target) n=1 Tax=Nonlabens ulvanivorans TaxID=906888 RepID=A0ABX5E6G1_NONUL|nr:S8 family serine peptidase [Nonlabens ulvanivorans]PRX12724.1 putative secreted protein (Por secretion system target) [Nonlabens ulvanivorans]
MNLTNPVNSILKGTISFLIICFSTLSFSQDSYPIDFQGDIITMETNIDNFQWSQFPSNSVLKNSYTGWIQFAQTPTYIVQQELKAAGITLEAYLPHRTYAFTASQEVSPIFLKQKGVITIRPYDNRMKLSHDLKNETIGNWAIRGDKILIQIQYFKSITPEEISIDLKNDGIDIIEVFTSGHNVMVAIDNDRINEIASRNYVQYMDIIAPPSIKEDTDGRGLHRSNNLDTQQVGGRNYTGAGIGVLVRDDGIVGPHIDFEGRIDNSQASGSGQTHGDGVAGILAGAGNLNPENRGMAAGSNVYISNYASSFLDSATTSLIANGDVQITNSSYGNGCNAGYTITANTVDTQINNTPSLLHVFSAGNSNGADCGYGAGGQWGNITGGHKQGKNVIATANVNDDGTLAGSSSNGPATDGRIKPDITAHGQGHISTNENNGYLSFGGTSGAAPGIAGVAAQLYDAYQTIANGVLPESALIKAIMLNTANDVGNTGPDFQYGWGIVNGLRAVKTIEGRNFFSRTVSQGTSQSRVVPVPQNASQVRIMLYWNDPAAATGVSTALVNDLDLVVSDPAGSIYNPWVLNSSPNAVTLNAPATTGIDRLNNMEQVVIDNPIAGDYTVDITGFNIPMGIQKFYVVYEIIEDQLNITYPNGGESLTPGSTEFIQWDATNTSGNLSLEYSSDNGTSWNAIATVSNTSLLYEWTVPNDVSGQCLVRITDSNGNTDTSDAAFSIAQRVTGLSITQVCPTYINVSWNAMPGATSYDIYTLGQQFMEVNGSSTTLSYSIPITNINDVQWIAISASGGNGWTSLRNNAIEYDGSGLLNCSLSNDLTVVSILNTTADFQFICNPGPIIVSASIENLGSQDQSNFTVSYQIDNNAMIQETYNGTLNAGSSILYNFNTPATVNANGAGTLRVWVSTTNDEQLVNDEKTLDYFATATSESLDIVEPFDVNGVLPTGWILDNPDGNTTWTEEMNVIGVNGNPTTAAFIDGANYTSRGQTDSFTTNYYDLNFNGTATLTFDLAKAQWSATYNDGLRVELSTDCGSTYNQIYFKDGLTLATVPYTNSTWTPSSASDWRQESIDLSSFVGNDIVLRFVNLNDYSNSTYIDNISLNSTLSNKENKLASAVNLYPNPANTIAFIEIDKLTAETVEIQIMNSLGQVILQADKVKSSMTTKLDVSNYKSGLYFVRVSTGELQTTKKLIIK